MIKTEEILNKGGKNKKAFCEIFRYEPENIEETSLGSLYIISELDTDENSEHLANLICSIIKREYYSSPHRGPLESLEASLKKANQTLNELANSGNLEWLGKIHFICASINKEDLLLVSQSGKAQAFLCRESALTNITKKLVPAPEKPHPAKTFQSVISGNIEPGDKLFFATPSIFELFDVKGFKELFEYPRIELISEQINKNLRAQKRPSPLGALLLEIVSEEPLVPTENDKRNFITPPINLEEILN